MHFAIAGHNGRMSTALQNVAQAQNIPYRTIGRADALPEALAGTQVLIDFTLPTALTRHIEACVAAKIALVVGTTGIDASQQQLLQHAAQYIAVVQSSNMSLGANVLALLVEKAAQWLPTQQFDAEVLEIHHRRKIDAPSGTALMLAQAVCTGRAEPLQLHEQRQGLRPTGGVGMAVMRGGDVVGDHTVLFASETERVELRHIAQNRCIFAEGAIYAAKMLCQHQLPPQIYTMRDVLQRCAGL